MGGVCCTGQLVLENGEFAEIDVGCPFHAWYDSRRFVKVIF